MDLKRKIILLSLLTGTIASSTINPLSSKIYNSIEFESFMSAEDASVCDEYVVDSNIKIPIYDSMVPQGITYADEFFLTTSYDYYNLNDSCVYVLDMDGNVVNSCTIGNKAHVGGICYDQTNELVWITGSYGNINAYNINSLLNMENADPIYSNLNVGNGLKNYKNPFVNSASFLTVFNNKLFVGNFSLSSNGFVKEYEINIDDKTRVLTLNYVRKFTIPNKVQGLSFYTKDNIEYIIFNRSYGKDATSYMHLFEYSEDIDDYANRILISCVIEHPPMLEQSVLVDDNIYSIYESSSLPYKDTHSYENLSIIDVDEYVKKLILTKDTK